MGEAQEGTLRVHFDSFDQFTGARADMTKTVFARMETATRADGSARIRTTGTEGWFRRVLLGLERPSRRDHDRNIDVDSTSSFI